MRGWRPRRSSLDLGGPRRIPTSRTVPEREVAALPQGGHDVPMIRGRLAALLVFGFISIDAGCYERPDGLPDGVEETGSTTMPQATSSDDPSTSTTTPDTTSSSSNGSSGQATTSSSSSTTDTSGDDTTDGSSSSSSGGDLVACDPLVQDCPRGEACYVAGDAFGCRTDASGASGGQADGCGAANECDPGLLCVAGDVVGSCVGAQCCSTLCDLAAPECPAGSPTCSPWFKDGAAPAGLDEVGVCSTL